MAITVNGKKVAGVGPAGLSPYQVAKAGGYTGTEQEFNEALAQIGQSGGAGKRVTRFTVGTSAAGWTADDCDYLCDGTDDQVEINAAIQALPIKGGEIVILDGTYNITATIAMNKNNVKLSGNGDATVLKRMWDSSGDEGVISINRNTGTQEIYNSIENLKIEGNMSNYQSTNNRGIWLYNVGKNKINGVVFDNCYTAIKVMASCKDILIEGNIISNCNYGVYFMYDYDSSYTIVYPSRNIVTYNIIVNNNCGVYVGYKASVNIVSNNLVVRGLGAGSDYTETQFTIRVVNADNNIFSGNLILGKDYVSEGGTSNTFVNNKFE